MQNTQLARQMRRDLKEIREVANKSGKNLTFLVIPAAIVTCVAYGYEAPWWMTALAALIFVWVHTSLSAKIGMVMLTQMMIDAFDEEG